MAGTLRGFRRVSKLLPRSMQKSLYKAWRFAGDEASYHALWLQGEGLVKKLIGTFIRRGFAAPEQVDDLYGTGMLAVGQSLQSWDPDRGAYSTYIWPAIRNSMIDFLKEESMVVSKLSEFVEADIQQPEEVDNQHLFFLEHLTEVLCCYYVAGMTDAEVGNHLGISAREARDERIADLDQLSAILGDQHLEI